MTRIGFVFVLISFIHMHGAIVVPWFVGESVGIRLKLDVQGQGSGKILDVDGQGGRIRNIRNRGKRKIRQFSWTSYVYRP